MVGTKFKFRPKVLKQKPLPGRKQRVKFKKKVVKKIKRAFPVTKVVFR